MVRLLAAVWLFTLAGGVAADIFAPDSFPIGVWLQQPKHAQRYKDLGVNLYVGLWQGPTSSQLAALQAAGMPVICAQNELALTDPNRDVIVGWLQQDEPDNAQPMLGKVGLGGLGWGSPVPPAEMMTRYRALRARDSSRPVLLNLGKGVAWDAWKVRGNRTGHPEDYREYAQAADIVSFDIYPATDRDARVAGHLELVALGVKRLVSWTGPGKRVWNVVGTSKVHHPGASIDQNEIRAQVWMSIISGSRGIIYFVHQFKPHFIEATWFENADLSAAMREINAQVQTLAPVINSPVANDVATVHPLGVAGSQAISDTLAITARRYGCSTYIFVASLLDSPQDVVIRIKDDKEIYPLSVLYENRIVRAGPGGYRDGFRPYDVHLYRAALSGGPTMSKVAWRWDSL